MKNIKADNIIPGFIYALENHSVFSFHPGFFLSQPATAHAFFIYGLLDAWLNVFFSEVPFVVVRLAEAEALENMKT